MDRLTFTYKGVVLEGIATYHDETLNKDFIVYTDMTYDDIGKLKIYYSLYKMIDNKINLIEVTTPEERKVGLQLIKDIVEKIIGTN